MSEATNDATEALAKIVRYLIAVDGDENAADAAASIITGLDAAGWVIVRKQATGKAEPPPTWEPEP